MLTLYLIFGLSLMCNAQIKTYAIHTNASKVGFNVSHLGVLDVDGTFQDFEGSVSFKNDVLDTIHASISVQSISTNDDSRDRTLVSESYFNIKSHPTIKFESNKIEVSSGEIIGNLTIKNETRKVVIVFQISQTKREISLSTQISRKDFKLKFGAMNSLIGDMVKINVLINY
ncbi:YceI family protein [uncultured Winogradskyella sp.]|uniref:YceI family protein n=1 Tax=uncultured Winogradskyella sp. TaxID=395353 RepID=UPI00262CCE66|nr:YceI family protein [uncultured Winogradskyella sp.]